MNKKLTGCYYKHNNWYRRVSIPLGHNKYQQLTINLNTKDMEVAENRNAEISYHIDIIKIKGREFELSWQSPTGKSRVVSNEFSALTKKFIEDRKLRGIIKDSTIELYNLAFNQILEIRTLLPTSDWNKHFNLVKLNNDHIRDIMTYYNHRLNLEKKDVFNPIKPRTVNIRYKCLRAFFRWLHDEEIITKIPRLDSITKGIIKKKPSYISNSLMDNIVSTINNNPKKYDSFLIDVFYFYRDTGMRLREPFNCVIDGNILTIIESKENEGREVELNNNQVNVYYKLNALTHQRTKQGANAPRNYSTHLPNYWSDKFKELLRECGRPDLKFHNLRDTFITRTWYTTGDIHFTSVLVGHKKVEMTRKYSQFKPSQLKIDFPDIYKNREVLLAETQVKREEKVNRLFTQIYN